MPKFKFEEVKIDVTSPENPIITLKLPAAQHDTIIDLGQFWKNYNVLDLAPLFVVKDTLYWDERDAMADLLRNEILIINSFWWKSAEKKTAFHTPPEDPWPEEACKGFSVSVNSSDIFAWGCADADDLEYAELEGLYAHWLIDNQFGPAVWCIKKRKMLPQAPVKDAIDKAGIWDLDSLNLEENYYDRNVRERREQQKKD